MDQIDVLTNKQSLNYKKLRDYYDNYIKNYGEQATIGEIDARLETYKNTWEKYQELDRQLKNLFTQDTSTKAYYKESGYDIDNVEEIYTMGLGKFYQLKISLTPKPATVQVAP